MPGSDGRDSFALPGTNILAELIYKSNRCRVFSPPSSIIRQLLPPNAFRLLEAPAQAAALMRTYQCLSYAPVRSLDNTRQRRNRLLYRTGASGQTHAVHTIHLQGRLRGIEACLLQVSNQLWRFFPGKMFPRWPLPCSVL